MMSLMNLGLTPDPLIHTLFALFIFVFTTTLLVLGFWDLVFLHPQEVSITVIFLRLMCLYQHESSPKVVDSSKCFGAQIPYFISKFETQFYFFSRIQTLPHSLQPL